MVKIHAHTEHMEHRSDDKSFFFVSSAILKQCVFSSYSYSYSLFFRWIFFFISSWSLNRFNRCSLGFIAITNDEEKQASFSSLVSYKFLLSASCTNSSSTSLLFFVAFLSFLMTLCRNSIVVFRPSRLFTCLYIDPLLHFPNDMNCEKRLTLSLSLSSSQSFSLLLLSTVWKKTNECSIGSFSKGFRTKYKKTKQTSQTIPLSLLFSLSVCISLSSFHHRYVCYKWIHVNVPLLHFNFLSLICSLLFFFSSLLFPLLFW